MQAKLVAWTSVVLIKIRKIQFKCFKGRVNKIFDDQHCTGFKRKKKKEPKMTLGFLASANVIIFETGQNEKWFLLFQALFGAHYI